MKYWITKDEQEIPYKKLEDSHLLNILKWIERRAKQGVTIIVDCGYAPDNDYKEYESYEIYGKEVKDHYDYKGLRAEAKKRGVA
jgi:hypothetical protein